MNDPRDLMAEIEACPRGVTRAMSRVGAPLPEAAWRQPSFLARIGAVAGAMLGAGKVSLIGRAPNGQQFVVNPLSVWLIADGSATLDGIDLGVIGPSPVPGRMADFRIPKRGVFAIGKAFFPVSAWHALQSHRAVRVCEGSEPPAASPMAAHDLSRHCE